MLVILASVGRARRPAAVAGRRSAARSRPCFAGYRLISPMPGGRPWDSVECVTGVPRGSMDCRLGGSRWGCRSFWDMGILCALGGADADGVGGCGISMDVSVGCLVQATTCLADMYPRFVPCIPLCLITGVVLLAVLFGPVGCGGTRRLKVLCGILVVVLDWNHGSKDRFECWFRHSKASRWRSIWGWAWPSLRDGWLRIWGCSS